MGQWYNLYKMNYLTTLAEKLTPKMVLILILALAVILGLVFWGAAKRLRSLPYLSRPDVNGLRVVVSPGTVIPADAKKPDEAVAEALAVPGYESEAPKEVEALPGLDNKIQYWSVKTDKGYVTVKAKP